ncbi:hypothetical protein D3C85_1134700 [compost metagenome]
MTTAASISHKVLDSEFWNASAAPWKRVSTAVGMPISASAAVMFSTASDSDAPGARLNDTVTMGNWSSRFTASTVLPSVMCATEDSGTCAPVEVGTWICPSAAGDIWNCGCTSSTTRYWLDCVKIVEISRCPKALYSASSITAAVMPRREAASRSISTQVCRPSSCRSSVTSFRPGTWRRRSTSLGVHSLSTFRSGLDRVI